MSISSTLDFTCSAACTSYLMRTRYRLILQNVLTRRFCWWNFMKAITGNESSAQNEIYWKLTVSPGGGYLHMHPLTMSVVMMEAAHMFFIRLFFLIKSAPFYWELLSFSFTLILRYFVCPPEQILRTSRDTARQLNHVCDRKYVILFVEQGEIKVANAKLQSLIIFFMV